MSYYAQCLKSYVDGFCYYNSTLKINGPYSDSLVDFNHMYILYTIKERVFIVHYTLEYGDVKNGVYDVTLKEIETLKYNDKSEFYFDIVSKTNIDKVGKKYTLSTNTYDLDIKVNIGEYTVSAYNYWYNCNNNIVEMKSDIHQIIMASD